MLTDRQLEILCLMAQGHTSISAGQVLFLSHKTVKAHLHMARTKLGAKNTAHAVAIALSLGVIHPDTVLAA